MPMNLPRAFAHTSRNFAIPALRDVHHTLVKRAQATTPESAVFDASGKLVYHGRIDNWYEIRTFAPETCSRSAAARRGLETGLHD